MRRRQRPKPPHWAPQVDYAPVVNLYRAFGDEPHADAEVLEFLQRAEALTLAVEANHAIACHAVDLFLSACELGAC
jgi:hypothetical protein